MQQRKIFCSMLVLVLVLVLTSTQVWGSTVHMEFQTFDPYYVTNDFNVTYVTSFGNYTFNRSTGSYQYTYTNGTLLAPSVRFIVQYLDNKSWENLNLTAPEFIEINANQLQFRQTVKNRTKNIGYIVVSASFTKDKAPKLSVVYDKPGLLEMTFRILFKVTIPQAWTYFQKENMDTAEITKTGVSYNGRKVWVLSKPENSTLSLLIDWSDFGETEAVLKGSTVSVIFPDNTNEIDPTTVAETNTDVATIYGYQRKVHYMSGRYWVFYCSGEPGSYIYYKHSKTGESGNWSNAIQVKACLDGSKFSSFFDGIYFHYAYSSGASNQPLKYRRATPNANGTLTWSDSEQDATPVGWLLYPSIAVDSNGYPFIAYKNQTASPTNPYVTKSSLNNGSWATASGFPYKLSTTGSSKWYPSVIPLTSGKMYAFYSRDSQQIKGALWNGSSWGLEENVTSSNIEYGYFYSAINEGDNIHLVFTKATNYLTVYVKRVYGSGWTSEKSLSTSLTVFPVITIKDADLYVFWEVSDVVYIKPYINGAWRDTVTWFSDPITSAAVFNVVYSVSNKKCAVIYTTTASIVKFEKFDFSATSGPFIVYSDSFLVKNATWNDVDKKLTFTSTGNLTIDTSTWGQPYTIYDGENFLDFTLSGSNITFSATGTNIEITWLYPPEQTGFRKTSGEQEEEETEETPVTPLLKDPMKLGLLGLFIGLGAIMVGGVFSAKRKKKVNRSPSGPGKTIVRKPSGVQRGSEKRLKGGYNKKVQKRYGK